MEQARNNAEPKRDSYGISVGESLQLMARVVKATQDVAPEQIEKYIKHLDDVDSDTLSVDQKMRLAEMRRKLVELAVNTASKLAAAVEAGTRDQGPQVVRVIFDDDPPPSGYPQE